MTQQPFVIERTYNAPVDKVWQAITDKAQMKQWYFDVPDFKPEVGTHFTFSGGSEEKTYLHLCEVLEVEQNRKIKYSWHYDGYEGMSYVTFELFDEGNNTRLKLTHEGIESFPGLPDFARSSFQAGWTELIGSLLPKFLEQTA